MTTCTSVYGRSEFVVSSTISSLMLLSRQRESCIHERISTSRTLVLTMVSLRPSSSCLLSWSTVLRLILGIVARRILDRYSPKIPCFNDDVQGTGCVTLAAIMSGLHVAGQKLSDTRVVIFGSGSAGCGIADQIRDAIVTESDCSREEAAKQIWYVPSLFHAILHLPFVTTISD